MDTVSFLNGNSNSPFYYKTLIFFIGCILAKKVHNWIHSLTRDAIRTSTLIPWSS